MLAARHAAELTTLVQVVIIPTRNVAEGVAAALMFDPGAPLAEQSERMTAEAAALRSFSVTTAARDSVVDGQPVRKGMVIALDADRHVLAQEGVVEAAVVRALARIGDFDLVTCYHGARLRPADLERLRAAIDEGGWGAEVELVPGGQRFEHLVVAVE
jgi:dihydroxyacetone kinase-like predicted kinase